MTRFRTLLAVSLAFASACGSDGPSTPEVTSVQVVPSTAVLEAVGATVQLAAQAKDASGATVPGVTATWSSNAPTVATVSASGLVTAVAPGTAGVTATIQGVASSAVVTVNQPSATCDDPTTVTLARGEATFFDADECFLLPSGAAGDRYRVVVTRPDSAGASSVVDATLLVTAIGVTQAPVPAAVTPSLPRASSGTAAITRDLLRAVEVSRATAEFHADLRAGDERLVQELLAGRAVLAPNRGDRPLRAAGAASPEKITIDTSTPNTCDAGPGPRVTALLVHENDDIAIYQDSVQRAASPVSIGNARRMANYYTAHAKGMIRSYFGELSDIDENGKLVVFVSPVANGNVAAFVWSGDFFTTESCPASNEMELIFFNSSVIAAMDNEQPNYQALETLAHEVKHVSSLYRRIQASLSAGDRRFHPPWIEEGTAEIAGEMSSRIGWAATGGPAVGAKITRTDLDGGSGGIDVTPENYGILLRMARTIWFLSSQPNGIVVSPSGAQQNHSIYGTGWNFHRWLGDTYGNAATAQADSSLFRALNDSTAPQGRLGLQQATNKTFKELFRDFVVAVSLHGTGAPEGPFPFATYDFITATNILAEQPDGEYPWPVTTTTGGPSRTFATASYTGRIGPTGLRIHDLVSNGTGTGARIQVTLDPPGEVVVVRLR
ncbi:MAG: Ig-like domain-containing protein [Longimicrobiales bacterium]